MTYKVELIHSEDGYAVGCPELPGCWSQGETEEEALSNIQSAISEYLGSVDVPSLHQLPTREIRYVEVQAQSGSTKVMEPYKVTPIPMGLPPFVKMDDLLDELEGPLRRLNGCSTGRRAAGPTTTPA